MCTRKLVGWLLAPAATTLVGCWPRDTEDLPSATREPFVVEVKEEEVKKWDLNDQRRAERELMRLLRQMKRERDPARKAEVNAQVRDLLAKWPWFPPCKCAPNDALCECL